eukprot:364787-Chlamydomonas_euryale.AAC.5
MQLPCRNRRAAIPVLQSRCHSVLHPRRHVCLPLLVLWRWVIRGLARARVVVVGHVGVGVVRVGRVVSLPVACRLRVRLRAEALLRRTQLHRWQPPKLVVARDNVAAGCTAGRGGIAAAHRSAHKRCLVRLPPRQLLRLVVA